MSLTRFLTAQEKDYPAALAEISSGRKRGHWMWYIFPQISGLGFSETSRYYAIQNLHEAAAYLVHPVLGGRLVAISKVLLQQQGNNANLIFGTPDDMKLRSCMTLFAALPATNPVFGQVLQKFFAGRPDDKTLALVGQE